MRSPLVSASQRSAASVGYVRRATAIFVGAPSREPLRTSRLTRSAVATESMFISSPYLSCDLCSMLPGRLHPVKAKQGSERRLGGQRARTCWRRRVRSASQRLSAGTASHRFRAGLRAHGRSVRRPRSERDADLPLVAEGNDDPPEPPPVLVGHGRGLCRAGDDGLS